MTARLVLVGALCAVLVGCADGEERPPHQASSPEGGAADPAEIDACLACHTEKKAAWAEPSSHSALLYCTTCHDLLADDPGPGHADKPSCSQCHSEAPHPDSASCTGCHDPHGTSNAFLIRAALGLPDGGSAEVVLGEPVGAGGLGLVHDGAPGTGVCEVCHTQTAHYDSSGTAAPHYDSWCPGCHQHADGFRPPAMK